jgi:putative ABC transport system permease protein
VFLAASPAAQEALAASARRDRSELGGLVTGVVTVEGQRAAVSDRALATFLSAAYVGGTVLGGVLTLLALLLLLETTRPARTQLVIRLRTLGLPHGGESRLAWTEVMPLLVVGVVAGVLAGVYAPVAVSAALDLSPFTGAVARLALEPRPVAGAVAGFGVLVLGALALLIDAVSARRGDLAQHLRRGDSA